MQAGGGQRAPGALHANNLIPNPMANLIEAVDSGPGRVQIGVSDRSQLLGGHARAQSYRRARAAMQKGGELAHCTFLIGAPVK